MSWWAVGISTALGAKKGLDNEARMDKNDKFRKAAITYSPWTGMSDPGSQQLPGMLESGLGGAATGAMVGSMGAKGAADGGATEALKIEPGTALPAAQQAIPTMVASNGMGAAGPYSAMGAQGSAGTLGGMNQMQDPNNPLLKYMQMKNT